jgi:aminoglycoside phosphotransferase family enzyme
MTTIVIQMDLLYEQVTHFHKMCEHQQVHDRFGELEEMEFRTDEERCLILFINDGPCFTSVIDCFLTICSWILRFREIQAR